MNWDLAADAGVWFAAGVNTAALLHCALHRYRLSVMQYVYCWMAVALNVAAAIRLIFLNHEYGRAALCGAAIAVLGAAWRAALERADATPEARARRTRGPRRYH